jgi:hypothetical protein
MVVAYVSSSEPLLYIPPRLVASSEKFPLEENFTVPYRWRGRPPKSPEESMTRLSDVTRELCREKNVTPAQLAQITGNTKQWAKLYLAGKIKVPAADTVQAIYEHLTGAPLVGRGE